MVSVLIIANQAPSSVVVDRSENTFTWWSQKYRRIERQRSFSVVCSREISAQHYAGNLVFPYCRIVGFAMFNGF